MNILIDRLPESLEVDGEKFDINFDFRTSILFEMMMQDDELDERDKVFYALNFYYPVIPRNKEEAVKKILWFYRGGKEEVLNGVKSEEGNNNLIYSYDFDAEYIYSAFLAQYGVDLQESYMHWWKFRAMFKSLRDDNEFVKIMGYRAMKITNTMSKEQQEFYRKMKKLHEIPKSKKENKKIEDIEKALLRDGDLSKVL